MKWLVFGFLIFILSCANINDPVQPIVEDYDSRLEIVDAASAKWIRHPGGYRGIADSDPIASECTDPGWSYIFYDDNAVIGYEPFPEKSSVLHSAVMITVELHNRDFFTAKWDYINVPIQAPPVIIDNDPELGKWQYALCIDDGTIVDGPYTAEFLWEWNMWKAGIARQQWEIYNRDHDPDAHIVWGPDA